MATNTKDFQKTSKYFLEKAKKLKQFEDTGFTETQKREVKQILGFSGQKNLDQSIRYLNTNLGIHIEGVGEMNEGLKAEIISHTDPVESTATILYVNNISSKDFMDKAQESGAVKNDERFLELEKKLKVLEELEKMDRGLLYKYKKSRALATWTMQDYTTMMKTHTQGEVLQLTGNPFTVSRGLIRETFSMGLKQITGKSESALLKEAFKKGGEFLAKKGVETAAVAGAEGATVAVAGVSTGGIAFVVMVAGKIVKNIGSKIKVWIKENPETAAAIGIGILALPFLGLFGAAAVGYGVFLAGSFLAGGTAAVGGAISGTIGSLIAGFSSLFVTSVAGPVLAIIIGLPVAIALILFIINSGAYITPPAPKEISGVITSPYIDVKKEASPDCLNRYESGCGSLPGEIEYNITVSAKKGTLTNVSLRNEYKVFGEGSENLISSPPLDLPEEGMISPTQPYSFSYLLPISEVFDNSIVIDTLTVTADAPEQAGAVASDVATVTIGNPPASSCPLLTPTRLYGSYNGRNETGHGSNSYWGSYQCEYDIPAFSGCGGPSASADPDRDNKCRGDAHVCSFYGYAADSYSPAGTPVFLPSIFGESLTWTLSKSVSINQGGWGHGHRYTSGQYTIYLGHLNESSAPSTATSGMAIGTLSGKLDNPHVHIELQIGGQWVKPDFLCGGEGP